MPREETVVVGVTFDVKANVIPECSITPFMFVEVFCHEEAMGSVPADLNPARLAGRHVDCSDNVCLGWACSCHWQSKSPGCQRKLDGKKEHV